MGARARKILIMILGGLCAAAGITFQGHACTGFCFQGPRGWVYARSFDWPAGQGLIVVNRHGVRKTAMSHALSSQTPARWTSKYGSLTFNQIGCDLPNVGVNQAGLFVQGFVFSRAGYPRPDARPAIGQTQFKQYLLDNFATVPEALAGYDRVRIHSPTGRYGLHYLVLDAQGGRLAISFMDGRARIWRGGDAPWPILTDTSTYQEHLDHLRTRPGFGGSRPTGGGSGSLDRFARTAALIQKAAEQPDAVGYAFKILKSVEIPGRTQWQVVFDSATGRFFYRTAQNPALRFIDVKALDFVCQGPGLILDINLGPAGEVTGRLEHFTLQAHRALLDRVNTIYGLPRRVIRTISEYPLHQQCQGKGGARAGR